MKPAKHIGIVAVSAEGAALCYRTICAEGAALVGPRIRVPEADLDKQVLAVFDKMRVEDEGVRDWFRRALASQARDAQAESLSQRAELQRQETLIVQQQDRLLNLRLADDIDQETFARKSSEIRDPLASIKLQLDGLDRSATKRRSWRRKCLNFRKRYASSGLPPITMRSVESSKSCV